jgi:predicted ATPase/class 3 adenylate cyclase/DNA-binding CsgD family transcriptional regulator
VHHLPTGTVTLLFTDMESSTRLLQQLGKRYAGVLEECRQILRTAFHTSGGQEVDTQGDAFLVAFARATDATSAAVSIQRTLFIHAWPEDVVVRVRMGLHTGEPQLAAEGYVGLDVHQAARIMRAAHGGQVVLSQTTRDLVQYDLPDRVHLRDLGEHRLKDLQRPSRLFQLVIADLPADFPPLKTLDSRPNNLPVQFTRLIGREQEVAAVQHLLQRESVHLVTLTGPGGTGKTRLGVQVTAESSDLFPDGVYFVNLAPISDAEFVVPAIAQTLGIREVADQSLPERLQEELQQKQVLLLLDNFEQVVSAALQVTDLLVACPKLKVLVTSREVLHVRAEHEFAVPPLALPDPTHLPELAALSHYAAVALFLQRAQVVKPEFQVTAANAPTIAEICVRLDGLPLAIELAAARVKLFPPQALLARLNQRLQVLTSGARDAPARQQSLRNTIAWSYDLLHAEEQRLFQRLSVFVGGCTMQTIKALGVALDKSSGAGWLLDRVASLIDKSLLQQTQQEGDEPRLVMLETIREYGLEALTASGEMDVTRHAHATYYLRLAEEAEPELALTGQLTGQRQVMWLEQLEREHENLRAALQWSVEQGEAGQSMEMALRLGAALEDFWVIRGHDTEGRTFLERALAGSEGVTPAVRAKALGTVGRLALDQGDTDRGEVVCEQSLALYRELGDTAGIALSLYRLGVVAWTRNNLTVSRSLTEKALALGREMGDKGCIARSLNRLAFIADQQGEYTRGRALCEESLALYRERESKIGIVASLLELAFLLYHSQSDPVLLRSVLEEGLALSRELGFPTDIAIFFCLAGQLALSQGNAIKARPLIEEALALFRKGGDRHATALALSLLARVEARQGNHPAARALYKESLAMAARGVTGKELIPSCLEGLAGVLASQGELARATWLWGAAETLRQALGVPIPPVERATYEQAVATARSQLGERAFAAAWAEGRTMSPEQALAAEGQPLLPTPTPPATQAATYPDGLTAREVEVLRLLAQGLTDAQIAEHLVLSLHTIHAHLRTIYSKLGVTSRSAATRYAFEHQLV